MKSKFIFAGITVAMMPFAVLSCTDTGTEDDRPEAVNEIIDVLETSLPQASSFTDLLKDADLSDVVSDELTVFAVQDDTQEKSETTESSSETVRRHIATGSYGPDDLYDGRELSSLSGEILEVTRDGDKIEINGVAVIGDAIPAGKSYIYLVESTIPSESEPGGGDTPEQPEQPVDPQEWENDLHDFWFRTRTLNQSLAYGYGGFTYNNVRTVSTTYWDAAYSIIDSGIELLAKVPEEDRYGTDALKIRLNMALVYSYIYGFYCQCIFKGDEMDPHNDINYLRYELDNIINYMPEEYSYAARALKARLELNETRYQAALDDCLGIIESGRYSLTQDDVFGSMDNPGVVWAGCEDTDIDLSKGAYFHPVRYEEVLLMAANATNELGWQEQAVQYVNQILEWKGMEHMNPGASHDEISEAIQNLFNEDMAGEGLEYQVWRRWGISNEKMSVVDGYTASTNSALPIPDKALGQYTFLPQNPGY